VDHFWDRDGTINLLKEWWYSKDSTGNQFRAVTYYDDTTHLEEGWDRQPNGTWIHKQWLRAADGSSLWEDQDTAAPPTLSGANALTSDADPSKPKSGWELMSAAEFASWKAGLLEVDRDDASAAHVSAPAERHVTSTALDEHLTASDHKDVFTFGPGFGHDTVSGFEAGPGFVDIIEFNPSVLADIKAVLTAAKQVGSDVVITIDPNTSISLKNVKVSNLTWDDFRFVA
jgi:hypothetical protein